MSKEHLTNSQVELKKTLEEEELKAELRQQLEQAVASGDYSQQLRLWRALLPYEKRPGLALTEIKELKKHLSSS
ncbi:MAG: hypothetical protein GX559_00905 [Candidatus Pacebacteria bacterium]|nr:hypothetical protein [Candidatus Paceibacterota bacterium]